MEYWKAIHKLWKSTPKNSEIPVPGGKLTVSKFGMVVRSKKLPKLFKKCARTNVCSIVVFYEYNDSGSVHHRPII